MGKADQENIRRIISELVAMLKPDYSWQADVLTRLKDVVDEGDSDAAKRLFASGAIWGGAGSVSDVYFLENSYNARKCELVIELVDTFARAGIADRAASEMATIYRYWIAQGVIDAPTT